MSAIRIRASSCVVAAIAAVCTACSGDARRAGPAEPLTVKIGMFYPKTVMPNGARELVGLFTSEPLVAAAWDGRPVFRLAETLTESEDRRLLTVKLRSDVRFHSGQPMTAPVVAELLTRKLPMVPEIASIVAIDDQHLAIRLHKPSTVKPEDLSALIVDSNDEKRAGLRTGPFRMASTEPPVLEPFDQYYLGRPAVQRVEIREYANHRAAWTGMMRHEVNFLHEVSRDAIEFAEAGGDIRAYPLLRPYYTALVFSMRHAELRRREVRVAINEAIDRNELVRNGMRGQGQIAEGPFWPNHWAYPQGRFPVSFNPEAARLRLEGVGLKVRPAVPREIPSRFSFTCMILEDDARFERIALLVQRHLYAVGIDMRIQPLPLKELNPRLFSGNFDAFLLEVGSGRVISWPYRYWHSPAPTSKTYARTGYGGVDAALERLQVARSDEEVREALLDVMHGLRADPPAAFLAFPRAARAADASIDVPYEPDRDIFGTLWQMKRAVPPTVARQ
jgi:peptide/nickel transport system substrate-binding protein